MPSDLTADAGRSAPGNPLRLVLDTQVWIDWLVFDDAAVAPIRAALAEGAVEVFIDRHCEAELERALGYRLGKRIVDVPACLAECRRASRIVNTGQSGKLPLCRDPDDQKFLELAAAARADCLITRDRALLSLAKRDLPFRILPPQDFARYRERGRRTEG